MVWSEQNHKCRDVVHICVLALNPSCFLDFKESLAARKVGFAPACTKLCYWRAIDSSADLLQLIMSTQVSLKSVKREGKQKLKLNYRICSIIKRRGVYSILRMSHAAFISNSHFLHRWQQLRYMDIICKYYLKHKHVKRYNVSHFCWNKIAIVWLVINALRIKRVSVFFPYNPRTNAGFFWLDAAPLFEGGVYWYFSFHLRRLIE